MEENIINKIKDIKVRKLFAIYMTDGKDQH